MVFSQEEDQMRCQRDMDGIWTYSLEDVWDGLKESYKSLLSVYREAGQTSFTI